MRVCGTCTPLNVIHWGTMPPAGGMRSAVYDGRIRREGASARRFARSAAMWPHAQCCCPSLTVLMKPYSMDVSCPPCVFSRDARPKLKCTRYSSACASMITSLRLVGCDSAKRWCGKCIRAVAPGGLAIALLWCDHARISLVLIPTRRQLTKNEVALGSRRGDQSIGTQHMKIAGCTQ